MIATVALASGMLATFAPPSAPHATIAATLEAPARVEGDGARRCGLGAAFHAGRRAALLAQIESGCVLVRGMPTTRDYVRFRQDKMFWYLTGIESPDAALLLDKQSGAEILFLPDHDGRKEMWEGEVWDAQDEWVAALTGFKDVRALDELDAALKQSTAKNKLVWISKIPAVALSGCFDRAVPADKAQRKDPFDGRPSREEALEANLREDYGVDVRDCGPLLAEMRRVKTTEEIDALRRANESGAQAMMAAMRVTRPGLGEWDLEAWMTWVQRRTGSDGPGYLAIVGSGPNALVLHYGDCTRSLAAGDMLLIDYAPEYDHYVADITRSWPVDGKFTPRMAELYDAVLAAQEAGIAAVAPGKTMADIDRVCRGVLTERGLGKLLPHGCCHYIGMEVHDVGDQRKPLVPGVAFTVEPGVYEKASGIGIRIEDVVVVTATGCEVLSRSVPKDRKTVIELVGTVPLPDPTRADPREKPSEPREQASGSR